MDIYGVLLSIVERQEAEIARLSRTPAAEPIRVGPPYDEAGEILDCGCTVTKGWRCPMHDAP